MPLRQFNRKEREDTIIGARRGDQSKIEMILESFIWLKEYFYKKFIHEDYKIFKEDYYQECDIKIAKCINELDEINYGGLCGLVKKSIINLTIDILKRNKKYNDFNVICSDTIHENNADDSDDVHNFDNRVVSDIVAYENYHFNIKHQLSPKENDIFFSHISGECFEVYAHKNGMKLESVKRIFRKAVNKIGNKDQIKKFHGVEMFMIAFLKNIGTYIGVLDIANVMVG